MTQQGYNPINRGSHSIIAKAFGQELMEDMQAMSASETRTGCNYIDQKKGDIYWPMPEKLMDVNPLELFLKNGNETSRERPVTHLNFTNMYLDDSVSRIDRPQADKEDPNNSFLLKICRDLLIEEGIYGVLLADLDHPDFIINMGHPMVTIMIQLGRLSLPQNWNLRIYKYKQTGVSAIRELNIDPNNNFYTDKYSQIFSQIPKIIQTEEIVQKIPKVNMRDLENLMTNFKWSALSRLEISIQENITQSGIRSKSLLIPIQVLVDGILIPYYGIAIIDSPFSEPSGYSITPMHTGNINQNSNGSRRLSGGSVCTGNRSNTTSLGHFTLNRLNASSMYYQKILDAKEALEFAHVSKYISSQIISNILDSFEPTVENEESNNES